MQNKIQSQQAPQLVDAEKKFYFYCQQKLLINHET